MATVKTVEVAQKCGSPHFARVTVSRMFNPPYNCQQAHWHFTPELRPALVIEPAYFLRSYMSMDSLSYLLDAPFSWVLLTSFLPLSTLAREIHLESTLTSPFLVLSSVPEKRHFPCFHHHIQSGDCII